MYHQANAGPSERLAALATVILLHGVAFALLLAQRASQPPLAAPGTLKVVALNADPAAATAPPPPSLPSKVADSVEPEKQLAFSTDSDPDAVAAAAAGCLTLESIRESILADPAAMASILRAPPETRSIAEAVVLWNVRWAQSAQSVEAPLAAARAAVERSLASASKGCLDEPITGPRLLPIPAGAGTMFIVFGSGTWTWREVAENQAGSGAPADPGAAIEQRRIAQMATEGN